MILAHSRWLAAGMSLLFAASPSLAQLKIADDPKGVPANLQFIALRPNAIQPIYFSYHMAANGLPRKIRISLEQIVPGQKAKEIATAEVTIKSKMNVPIAFKGIPAPKEGGKEGGKGDPVWPSLGKPPFAFRFTVVDGDEVTKLDVPVKLQEPREYVRVREAQYDPAKRRLSFKLSSTQPLDPPCPVELELHPSAIPGLIPSTAGTLKQKLSKDNPEVELSAENIEFERGVPPENGRIYLNVDGFERAFAFKCAFAAGALTPLKDESRVRLVAARYSPSQSKIPVTIEVDVKSQEEGDEDSMQRSRVEVSFDRGGQGSFEKAIGSPFPGLRDQSVEYKSDDEAIVFKTKVKDRVFEIDAEGINGSRLLKVRLLSSKLGVIAVADEQDSREEKVSFFIPGKEGKFAPLTFNNTTKEVIASLIFDSTPAEALKILSVPARTAQEAKLTPRLKVTARAPGKQAPIKKVYFFFGEADENHKVSDKSVKIEAVWDAKQEAYVPKEEMIAPEQKGKTHVSALVETATGALMSTKQPLSIVSKDALNAADPDVLTTITGQILRGDLGQPGVTVVLAKAKPKADEEKKEAKTKDDGTFEFADVEPGNYIITAQRLGAVSRLPLVVPKNKEKISELKLQLKVK